VNESPEPREPGRRTDLERFADLDAGLLDDEQAARLLADPRAQAVHAALTATRAELASLRDPPVPAEFAARWDAALAAEAHRTGGTDATTTAPGIDDAGSADEPPEARGARSRPRSRAARPPRRGAGPGGRPSTHRPRARRRRPRPALIAATGLAALIAVTALWPRPTGPSLDEVNLATTARESIGLHDVGDLSDPARRTGCLRAVAPPGIPPDGALLGGRRVEFDGRPAVLLVLAGGELGRLHIVIVDPECGPAGGTLLHADTIGQ
jgi:hypothetical protein